MIDIIDKYRCCGCEACSQACPKQCISLISDEEGFNYPKVNIDECVSCGICETVCPFLHPYHPLEVISSFAVINDNEYIRKQSSSGGVFTLIAEKVIEDGGVVFGAKFNRSWGVEISYTESKSGIGVFRGSKYLQARVGNSYDQCKRFLNDGRKVLYTGTPCHIAGLNHYLRKDYDNLYTCDVMCHGVPSPGIWKRYIKEVTGGNEESIISIDFRNKSKGWKDYSVVICTGDGTISTPYRQNPFMRAFLNDLILRPSCHECLSKAGRSHADITIADFWGIDVLHPEMYDDKGASLLLIKSKKGADLLGSIEFCRIKETSYFDAISFNPAYIKSAIPNAKRDFFFNSLAYSNSVEDLIHKSLKQNKIMIIRNKLNKVVSKLFK